MRENSAMTGLALAARRATRRLAPLGLLLAAAPLAAAFHQEGVGNCGGCHVLHDPGAGMVLGDPPLLKAPSASDVCLLCHGDGGVLGDDPLTPPAERGAGNFVFLLEDNLNDGPDGAVDLIPGDAAGHNLVAPGRGLFADFRYSTAPGGSFPASELGCTSCHDPHGNSSFMMLNGVGPVQEGLATFTAPAPDAEAIDPLTVESPGNHTAYRSGMSAWCGNCHGPYHDAGVATFEHPIDEDLGGDERDEYNRYDGPQNPDGGLEATAYLPEVPFEDPRNAVDSTLGPSPVAVISCITCHRAHASSAPAAGRWDFNVGLLQEDGLISGSYPLPDPYADPDQGPLCRKCHETIPD